MVQHATQQPHAGPVHLREHLLGVALLVLVGGALLHECRDVIIVHALFLGVFSALAEEVVPAQGRIHEQAETLDVALVVIVAARVGRLLGETLEFFGAVVHGGAIVEVGEVGRDFAATAEVDEFAVKLIVNDDVLGFDVVVREAQLVQDAVAVQYVIHDHARGSLAEAVLGLEDEVEQLAVGALLDDVLRFLAHIQHLDGVLVRDVFQFGEHALLGGNHALFRVAQVSLHHEFVVFHALDGHVLHFGECSLS